MVAGKSTRESFKDGPGLKVILPNQFHSIPPCNWDGLINIMVVSKIEEVEKYLALGFCSGCQDNSRAATIRIILNIASFNFGS